MAILAPASKCDFGRKFQQIKTDFNVAMVRLEEELSAVIGVTEVIKSGSNQIATASDNLSQGTELQASNFEETMAAIGEITEAVQKTAESTKHARDVVAVSRNEAQSSGEIAVALLRRCAKSKSHRSKSAISSASSTK